MHARWLQKKHDANQLTNNNIIIIKKQCPALPGQCTATPFCAEMKTLWKHVTGCHISDCSTPHCLSSRFVFFFVYHFSVVFPDAIVCSRKLKKQHLFQIRALSLPQVQKRHMRRVPSRATSDSKTQGSEEHGVSTRLSARPSRLGCCLSLYAWGARGQARGACRAVCPAGSNGTRCRKREISPVRN